ncbi:MAG: undecaprenyl-diphosphate phosphatase [Candidatus Kerfeldbacteria bacterium]|nr:undecaprenyl-diphosphate phosphatase [Candidatus Kerfeldbacteria bacterium]
MDLWQTIILGIVEGVTEFLPISSTGHMILTNQLLGVAETGFVKTFTIFIQLGAIGAVIVLYARQWLFNWEVIKRLLVAFLPTAVIGLVFYHLVKTYLLGNSAVVLGALLLGGAGLIIFEYIHPHTTGGVGVDREPVNTVAEIVNISYRQAFIIGLCQAVAIVPGVSRAAATIIAGLALGLKRRVVVEFSFLLAVPTMAAAAAFDLLKSLDQISVNDWKLLLVGFLTALVVALAAIKFLLQFIKKHDFTAFGWYRIGLAVLFWWLVL